MGWGCPRCTASFDTFRGYSFHFRTHDGNPLVAAFGEADIYHHYVERGLSENALADHYGVSRPAMKKALEACPFDRRGQSDAEQLKWEQMTADERAQQVAAAHDANRVPYAQFRTAADGYEEHRVATDGDVCKAHRLHAVALFGWDAVVDNHVHHRNGLKWDNREDNYELLSESEHKRLHTADRDRDTDGRFV